MFALLASGVAEAALYNVLFCAEYDVVYSHAYSTAGDDYVDVDGYYPARGARIKVVRNDNGEVMADEFAAWDGSNPGCLASAVTLNSDKDYNVKVRSYASINGNTLYVYNDDTNFGIYGAGPGAYSPTGSGVYTIRPATGGQAWQIANAVGHAMYRRSGGLSGETFNFFNEAGPGGGTEYDRDSDGVYISSGGLDNKYMIVHEFGHMLAARANDTGSCATPSCAANKSYSASYHDCFTNDPATGSPYSNHSSNSQEYASAAVWEGLAHYYSVVAFNDTAGSDCEWVYYKQTNWNLDTDSTDADEPAVSAVSCATAPATPASTCDPSGPDYLASCCDDGTSACDNGANGNCDNRSTEYDWLRFFWDLDTDQGLTTTNILNIWDEADPDTWNDDDDGAAGNDPAPRLRNAADTLGYLDEWDAEDDYNGVHR